MPAANILLNLQKEVVRKKHNYEIKEFISWNKTYKCPHALNYDEKLGLFIDLKQNYGHYKIDGIYVSKDLPSHLEDENGGIVLYNGKEKPLIERFKRHCQFPYFKQQMSRILDFHFERIKNKR